MRLTIQVKPDHIKQGKPGSPHKCPIALAIEEAGGASVTVTESDIEFVLNRHSYEVLTPEKIVKFLDAFDVGDPVTPLTFSLNARRFDV